MKIVSPNFLAAGCCISLLTVPTIAAKKQQRLRTLEGDTVDSSLSIPSIEAAAMQHMTGSKSAKSEGPGSAKSAKSEWEGVASKSAKSAAGSGTTQDQDVVLSNLDTPGVCGVTSAFNVVGPGSQINCFTTDGPTTLNSVRFWLGDGPVAGLLVRVYDGTVEGGPDGDRDAFLVEQDFTPNFGGVNTVTLENPLEITGDGFCVGVVGPQFGLQLEGDGVVGDGAGQGYYRTSGSSEFIGIDLKLCIEALVTIGGDSAPEDGSKSAKSGEGSAKSAKSEWKGIGDWSKSAKSSDDSAKSAKSEWEGVGKSAKSEDGGIGDWSKSSKSKSAKSVDMVEAPVEPPKGMEWICGWNTEVNVITEAQVNDMMESILSAATKENIDGLLDKYDIDEDTIAAALVALGGL